MKLTRFYLFTLLYAKRVYTTRLVNTKKLCRDCKHFIANDWECGKFGDVNLVTGKETFDTARSARNNENKCGEEAKHFEVNDYKFVTVPYYFFKTYWAITPAIFLLSLYFNKLYEIISN